MFSCAEKIFMNTLDIYHKTCRKANKSVKFQTQSVPLRNEFNASLLFSSMIFWKKSMNIYRFMIQTTGHMYNCLHDHACTWIAILLFANNITYKKLYLGFLLLFKHGFVSTFFAKFLQRFHCFTVGSPNDLVTIRIFFVLGLKITTGFLLPWDDFLFK